MKQILLYLLVLITPFLNGCGPSANEYDAIKKENESLKTENSTLKKEIEDFKFGSIRLYSMGKREFEEGKFEAAKQTIEGLLAKHPDALESKEASLLLDKAVDEIAKKDALEREKIKRAEQEEQVRIKKENEIRERETQEKKKRVAGAIKKMTIKQDELEGITFYTDSSTHPYHTSLHLYAGKRGEGSPWLRIKARYSADDWLFVKSFFVVADGQRFEKPIAKFKRDNGSGSIWEWYDENISDDDLKMILTIIHSKKSTIRFVGDQYHADHTITAQEKQSLQNVLDVFVALGGYDIRLL